MVTAYLGPEGSYSGVAAEEMTPENALCPMASFAKVFGAVTSGAADCAVIPVENTLNGGVSQTMDLLQSSEGLAAVKESIIKIDHRLVTLAGADLKRIARVYSHPQALEQCAEYLAKNFPEAKLIASASTVAGLETISSLTDAGIVGAHTERAGYVLSRENIADDGENYTHFLLIKRGRADENARSRRVFFSVTCANRAGALLSLLQPLCANGLNMTKIHSRPIKDKREEYRFFIETEGDYSSARVKRALTTVAEAANSFKLLGCY